MYVCTDSPVHTTEEIADAADACTRPATPELLWAVIAGLDFQLLSCVFSSSMHVGLAQWSIQLTQTWRRRVGGGVTSHTVGYSIPKVCDGIFILSDVRGL